MAEMKIIRQPTVASQEIVMRFDTTGKKFLICNYADGDIYVAFDLATPKENRALIEAGCSRVLLINEYGTYSDKSDIVAIIPDVTSEKGVEVQCLMY